MRIPNAAKTTIIVLILAFMVMNHIARFSSHFGKEGPKSFSEFQGLSAGRAWDSYNGVRVQIGISMKVYAARCPTSLAMVCEVGASGFNTMMGLD